ncbi:MAG: amidohydrolase [Planctomycetaceae bacterium]|nr:amidohydrolase [Planctomycetaceae bacterium]
MKLLSVMFLLITLFVSDLSAQMAETVYTNGKIYTMDEEQPWVEAVAIKDGKFIRVGSAEKVKPLVGKDTEVVDLHGDFVMPGILDLHSHPFITPWYGTMNLKLQNPNDPEKILQEVKAYAAANPDRTWILGGQYGTGIFPDDAPNKAMLDAIVPDRPVVLLDQTGHTSWLNSKALEMAGINKDTESNHLMVILKDPETGEPTGTIRELSLQMVERVIPQATAEQYAKPIEQVFDDFASLGITTQQTAEGHRAPLQALKMLEAQGRLKQRVFVSWDWKTTLNLAYTLEDIEEQIENRANYESEMIRPNYVKIYSDGSPMAGTALLLTPYEDDPQTIGAANMSVADFAEAFIKFDKMGVGVHVHSLGSGSIRRVIEAFEIMKQKNGESGVRHKIAHNMMISKQDLSRLAKIKDVNLDFSPPLWYPNPGVVKTLPPKIGDVRYQMIYPVKSALQAGLHVGQGADWQTAYPTPNPFPALEGMITRQNPDNPNFGSLNAAEAVSLAQALKIFTLGGAWVLGAENEIGSIEEGKFADMIILDQNLFDLEKAQRLDRISKTKVLKTILGGRVIYDPLAN